jgi:hypothetical protein
LTVFIIGQYLPGRGWTLKKSCTFGFLKHIHDYVKSVFFTFISMNLYNVSRRLYNWMEKISQQATVFIYYLFTCLNSIAYVRPKYCFRSVCSYYCARGLYPEIDGKGRVVAIDNVSK